MTGPELEVAGTDTAAGLTKDAGAGVIPAGKACANCGDILQGRFCHSCGQSADRGKRSVFRLVAEGAGSLVNYDNRLFRTLALLFLKPGVLANDMIEGRIVRHTPPFRTFLIAVSVVILASTLGLRLAAEPPQAQPPAAHAPRALPEPTADPAIVSEADLRQIRESLISELGLTSGQADALMRGIKAAISDETRFSASLIDGFAKFLVYIIPGITSILAILYAGRKDIFIEDHFRVACYIASFLLIPIIIPIILSDPWDTFAAVLIAIWNAFGINHVLRVGYGSSAIGAFLKTCVLWAGIYGVLLALLLGVFFVTLFEF
ncbi:MAG: DUF3667 domain-containing protein [Phenylobacterium sp.]|nr:DUF3667 domain-containing protein [Phenylobacterium sp.]